MDKETVNDAKGENRDTASVTLLIAERPYQLKVEKTNEEKIVQLCREINERILRFQQNYPRKDKQDCLAMSILAYAIELEKANELLQNQEQSALSGKLKLLEEQLDDTLKLIE